MLDDAPTAAPLPDLLPACAQAMRAAEALLVDARRAVAALVSPEGTVDPARLERHQFAAHGYAWMATYVEALRQMLGWAERLHMAGTLGEREALIVQAAFGEYLNQLGSGIAMSQGEIARPADLGIAEQAKSFLSSRALARLLAFGNCDAVRARLVELLEPGDIAPAALNDDTLDLIAEQFRRFAADKIAPVANDWHRADTLIPIEIVRDMAGLGVFGLTVPEAFGGQGLGKVAMCVVTEALSRAFLGVGSLGTRSEIAGELIRLAGTDAQKQRYLPKIADGSCLPTAVFTEPDTGSDLGALKTRAVRDGAVYRISGAKTWITHGARSDLMTLLVRTGKVEDGHRGLSMFLAEKPRGTDDNPFPAAGMRGGEIRVLGYRGMKEYEIAFDNFTVPVENLLGGEEGKGFVQLMATFEIGPHPDGGARGGCGGKCGRCGPGLCASAPAIRQAHRRLPARGRQDRLDGGGDDHRAPAHLFCSTPEGQRTALRYRGRHGEAVGRAHRMVGRRQRGADPWRQRLC